MDHDVALVVGPVFPHEVVGFSGGTKYFFPGVAGPEIIDLTHWLGALIGEASALIPSEQLALCVVVWSGRTALHSAAFGEPRAAWAAAAAVSAETHVRYLDAPVRRVLSLIPQKYDDVWTAAKGFYELEPVVADGGEVILSAPHITLATGIPEDVVRGGNLDHLDPASVDGEAFRADREAFVVPNAGEVLFRLR